MPLRERYYNGYDRLTPEDIIFERSDDRSDLRYGINSYTRNEIYEDIDFRLAYGYEHYIVHNNRFIDHYNIPEFKLLAKYGCLYDYFERLHVDLTLKGLCIYTRDDPRDEDLLILFMKEYRLCGFKRIIRLHPEMLKRHSEKFIRFLDEEIRRELI